MKTKEHAKSYLWQIWFVLWYIYHLIRYTGPIVGWRMVELADWFYITYLSLKRKKGEIKMRSTPKDRQVMEHDEIQK